MIPLGTIASSYNAPGGILILDSFDRADSDTLGFADTGEEFDIRRLLDGFTMDVISKCAYGIEVDSINQPDHPSKFC